MLRRLKLSIMVFMASHLLSSQSFSESFDLKLVYQCNLFSGATETCSVTSNNSEFELAVNYPNESYCALELYSTGKDIIDFKYIGDNIEIILWDTSVNSHFKEPIISFRDKVLTGVGKNWLYMAFVKIKTTNGMTIDELFEESVLSYGSGNNGAPDIQVRGLPCGP